MPEGDKNPNMSDFKNIFWACHKNIKLPIYGEEEVCCSMGFSFYLINYLLKNINKFSSNINSDLQKEHENKSRENMLE